MARTLRYPDDLDAIAVKIWATGEYIVQSCRIGSGGFDEMAEGLVTEIDTLLESNRCGLDRSVSVGACSNLRHRFQICATRQGHRDEVSVSRG
jgi:hypothetical protein